MCRSLLSVDWQGELYDCDFNQMLGLRATLGGLARPHLRDLLSRSPGSSDADSSGPLQHDVAGTAIRVADHCHGCTAGQGSSCGGALHEAAERPVIALVPAGSR
jgi:hypothetical protein